MLLFQTAIQLGETRKLTVLTHLTDRPSAPCSVVSTSPKGEVLEMPVSQIPDGYEVLFTPKEKGEHKVKVTFANQELPNSPFTATVEAIDVSGVVVKGLEKGNVGKRLKDLRNSNSTHSYTRKQLCKSVSYNLRR